MKIKGIDFPKKILNALRDDKLVVFAGAGVSMGDPANLPSFKELAIAIAHGTGETLQDHEPEDQFLGRLEQNGTNVHELAKHVLSQDDPQPTQLHHDLMRLYPRSNSPRIVTTNFDLLFKQAAKGLFESEPGVFNAPELPLGRNCEGIVHIHGTVDRPNGMVLTDKDFGHAYLTDGWAVQFLVELFQSFTVLFVGYSHSDAILNYLSRALRADNADRRFVLTDDARDSRWEFLGVEPIHYLNSPDNAHCALYNGVRGLANHARRSILDWQQRISEIAAKPPVLDAEETDLIEYALTDESKTRFFIDAASSIEWVRWLDERNYLGSLFGTNELNDRDFLFIHWLAEKFTFSHPDEILLLIGRKHAQPHPALWDALCRSVASQDDPLHDPDTLSRWISILLTTAPDQFDNGYSLLCLGEHCIRHRLWERAVDVFDAMSASRVVVKRGFPWPDSDEEEPCPRIDIELAFVSEHFVIDKLWLEGLKPNLNRISEPLLSAVVGQLNTQHRNLSAWQEANRDWNPVSHSRSAIEPHEQDRYPETIDVLIDAARDCLQSLASNCREVAARWCDRLASEEAPLLRRMAVHSLNFRKDLNSDDKIDWLLSNMDLNDFSAHHELFMFLKKTYADIDGSRRKAVLRAIQAHRVLAKEDDVTERRTADYHFQWFHWLHTAAHECPFTREALEDVLRRFPGLRPSDRPELTHWIRSVCGGRRSPWTAAELLSRPPEYWCEELISFRKTDVDGFDRFGLLDSVSEAARREFEWGVGLADALIVRDAWETDLWDTLIRVWSMSELDEANVLELLERLGRNELHEKHSRSVAEFLLVLVKDDSSLRIYSLLDDLYKIAARLWSQVDSDDPPHIEFKRWHSRAVNHTSGILTYFWLHSLECWRNRQEPKPNVLKAQFRNAFTSIVKDDTIAGTLGRAILACEFSFLLTSDEVWTKKNLLPCFSKAAGSDDYIAVWDGFFCGSLNPTAADLLKGPLLSAVPHLVNDPSSERRKGFVSRYITMLSNFVDDPHVTWIPRFFEHADELARRAFALRISDRLSDMSGVQQREWWDRWLRQYWANRLNGVPKGLNGVEVESMLRWLPNLEPVFAEAVKLAVRMPTENAKHDGELLYRIRNSDLCDNHPEAVAKLLIYLGQIPSEHYARSEEIQIIDILVRIGLSDELTQGLKELAATRGFG
ncbi:MAG: DUF4020 domain-containing protein [Gemmatimonadota bacterium]|nr:DUF4020 domain-containing protein [Gemmatimonadota bacterium]